jgi:hypothetical protein
MRVFVGRMKCAAARAWPIGEQGVRVKQHWERMDYT